MTTPENPLDFAVEDDPRADADYLLDLTAFLNRSL
jgi:hypothetical protein